MRALYFLKLDWIRCKSQTKFLILFPLFAIVLYYFLDFNTAFSACYLTFVAIIFSGNPFSIEQQTESGFLDMLPCSKIEKVAGRFLYALSLMLLYIICTAFIMFLYADIARELILPITFGLFGIGIAICSLQNILFYALGKIKSQQFMGIVRMLPGFIIFFSMVFLIDDIQDEAGDTLLWLTNHLYEISLGVAIVGLILFILGIVISSQIIKNRDFT